MDEEMVIRERLQEVERVTVRILEHLNLPVRLLGSSDESDDVVSVMVRTVDQVLENLRQIQGAISKL